VARTLSAALTAEQKAVSSTPYIRVYVNATDYWSRLLYLEHVEEAYGDRATIILRNDDRALDIGTLNLIGKELYISYGHITGNAVAEPDGNNSTAEYSRAAILWVKGQQNVSVEGNLTCQLQCEGMWNYLREQRVMSVGNAPYYDYEWTTSTPYALMEHIIETAMGWTLSPLGAADDGIINTFLPTFVLNTVPWENAAAVLYRLLWMTKCFLRAKTGKVFEVVYPQAADNATQIYYSDQAHFFKEYTEKNTLLIPNKINVFANRDADGGWGNVVTGTASDAAEIAKYVEVLEPFVVESITTQANADARAEAILSKIRAEKPYGRVLVPHDASVELYDRPSVHDNRVGALVYPTGSLVRAANLVHRYSANSGVYTLEIVLGDMRSKPDVTDPRLERLARERPVTTIIREIKEIRERVIQYLPRELPPYYYQELPLGAPPIYPPTPSRFYGQQREPAPLQQIPGRPGWLYDLALAEAGRAYPESWSLQPPLQPEIDVTLARIAGQLQPTIIFGRGSSGGWEVSGAQAETIGRMTREATEANLIAQKAVEIATREWTQGELGTPGF